MLEMSDGGRPSFRDGVAPKVQAMCPACATQPEIVEQHLGHLAMADVLVVSVLALQWLETGLAVARRDYNLLAVIASSVAQQGRY